MEYKKVFLDTCVLSDIGRMNEEDRRMLAFNFLVNYKFQIIITLYQIMELENFKDEQIKNNVYNFLEICYVGIGKNFYRLFEEEVSHKQNIDIVEYNLSIFTYDKDNNLMNFKGFKDSILNSKEYQKNKKEHDDICADLQLIDRPTDDINLYTKVLIIHNLKKYFNINNFDISYNDIPGLYTYSYSYANKIGSSSLKEKPTEINDICMSYLAPYMDIIVAERKQVARYMELKQKKDFNRLDHVIIKKHSDVIKYNTNGSISFNLTINI